MQTFKEYMGEEFGAIPSPRNYPVNPMPGTPPSRYGDPSTYAVELEKWKIRWKREIMELLKNRNAQLNAGIKTPVIIDQQGHYWIEVKTLKNTNELLVGRTKWHPEVFKMLQTDGIINTIPSPNPVTDFVTGVTYAQCCEIYPQKADQSLKADIQQLTGWERAGKFAQQAMSQAGQSTLRRDPGTNLFGGY